MPLRSQDLTKPRSSREIESLDLAKLKASGLSEEKRNPIAVSIEHHTQTQVVSPFIHPSQL